MRKEVLAAIIIGITLGAVVAFGIWRAKSYLSPRQISPAATEQNTQPETHNQENTANSDLVVTQPEENTVSPTDKITVKGSANPKSTVVIISNGDQQIIDAKDDGSFEQEISLDAGPNEINVTAYDDQGNEATQTMIVVYSTEMAKNE